MAHRIRVHVKRPAQPHPRHAPHALPAGTVRYRPGPGVSRSPDVDTRSIKRLAARQVLVLPQKVDDERRHFCRPFQ
jgi:hypothetical protein